LATPALWASKTSALTRFRASILNQIASSDRTSNQAKATPKILFVGAFLAVSKTGHSGGQTFASRSLVSSSWGQSINWVQIDTSAETNLKRSFWERFKFAVGRLRNFRKQLRREAVDAVLIFTSAGFSFVEKGLMALWAKRTGHPVIFAPRSGLIIGSLERSSWMRRFATRVIARCDYIICQSEFWQDFYQNLAGGDRAKYISIHNWIHTEPYVTNRPQSVLSSAPEPTKVLFLGWVDRNKGVYDLIDAAKELRDLPVLIQIAGHGVEYDNAVALVKELQLDECIQFLGWVNSEQKMNLLQKSDIYVLPSYFEGYPNALLEAMASGLPCVASRITSTPDIIEDGTTGLLFPAGDATALAAQLRKLVEDPQKRIQVGEAGRKVVLHRNQVENATPKLDQIIQQLMSKSL
jgi:glycosyltransferase involved in cell wall biosynthesis